MSARHIVVAEVKEGWEDEEVGIAAFPLSLSTRMIFLFERKWCESGSKAEFSLFYLSM
jgi:hypothetical protein